MFFLFEVLTDLALFLFGHESLLQRQRLNLVAHHHCGFCTSVYGVCDVCCGWRLVVQYVNMSNEKKGCLVV